MIGGSIDNRVVANAIFGLVLLVCATRPLLAQTDADALNPVENQTSIDDLTLAIEERAARLESDTERALEVKDALSKLYEQSLFNLSSAAKFAQIRDAWTKRIQAAPEALSQAREDKGDATQASVGLEDLDLERMEYEECQSKLRALEAELATVSTERARLAGEPTSRAERRKELPTQVSKIRLQLDQLQPIADDDTEDVWVIEAARWNRLAIERSLTLQIESLEAELSAYDAEESLLPIQLELAENREKILQDAVRQLTEELTRRKSDRITGYAIDFRQFDAIESPSLQRLRQWLGLVSMENEGRAAIDWRTLATRKTELKAELEAVRGELDRWLERRKQMRSRVESAPGQEDITGFNSWVGLMLRQQRGELPGAAGLAAKISGYRAEVQQADSLIFELDDMRLELRQQFDALDAAGNDPRSEMLKSSLEILSELRLDVDDYLAVLYDMADASEQTRLFAEDYREFIDRHVLWIRSTERLDHLDRNGAGEAIRWLLDYRNWQQLVSMLWADAKRTPSVYVLWIVGMLPLIWNQVKLRRNLGQIAQQAERSNCTDFRLTLRALLLTVLIAIPVPLGLLFFAWRLHAGGQQLTQPAADVEFAAAIGQGCLLTAALLFPLDFLRQLCRPNGLGCKHFQWWPESADILRANLRWLIDFSLPLAAISGIMSAHADTRFEASLGRIAFMLLMPLLAIFFVRVLAPRRGVLENFLERNQGGWLDRLRWIWFPALVALPLLLAAMSFLGYHYTSGRIADHLEMTLWMVVGLVVGYGLLMRWLMLSRRTLMLAQARQRLERAAKGSDGEGAQPLVAVDEEVNLIAINAQTKRLAGSLVVALGLFAGYLIWEDILPAVSLLDGVTLWRIDEGQLPGPEDDVYLTLANLVLVVPIAIMVVIATRNLPGLLEIAVLQHLPIAGAVRYAVTTLASYAIMAIGIVVVSTVLGLQWSSIQWLVAALGVGLGFGLQEIFANFVSGIILLFEQPIRVGDVITIGGTTGTVSKIRMRATTIVNWDCQELIVPNKELITGTLLNWTLTDTTNRIVVQVGIAYGSDTARACQLVRDICEQHPNILGEPGPIVTFEGFGDNTLNLVLRAYLATLDNRLTTIHEIHEQIYRVFGENGIEIAFPQRDLHIRSIPKDLVQEMLAETGPRRSEADSVA